MSRRTLDCFEACMLSMGEPLDGWEPEYDDDEELDEDEEWIKETSRFDPEDECPECGCQLRPLGKRQYCLNCNFDSIEDANFAVDGDWDGIYTDDDDHLNIHEAQEEDQE